MLRLLNNGLKPSVSMKYKKKSSLDKAFDGYVVIWITIEATTYSPPGSTTYFTFGVVDEKTKKELMTKYPPSKATAVLWFDKVRPLLQQQSIIA